MTASRSDTFKRFSDYLMGDGGLTAFLVLLFLALFLGPFIDSAPVRLLTSLFFSLLMVAGAVTMSRRPKIRFFAGVCALVAISLRWFTHIAPTPVIQCMSSLTTLIFLILLTVVVLTRVFKDNRPVTIHRIMGAIAAYLLFGITWAILYSLLDQILPQAFNNSIAGRNFDPERQGLLTYYSFITLTTVGYGDMTPMHDVSRMFAVMEALLGQLYPATLLARLVSLEVSHRGGQKDDPS
jgi:hypothetical protein